jgi:chloride channel 7
MEMSLLRWESTQFMAKQKNIFLGWFALSLYSIFFTLIASMLTVYFAPNAAGSGVPEAIGFLNGVHVPNFINFKTLVVKFLGLCLAIAGGVCGGKEGPLIHMGAIVGVLSAYLPCRFNTYFRNDLEKRKLIAIGIAAGMSSAFGAPIGGSLYAYELSKPNTFWSFSLTWKVFFASTISTFTLSILKQAYDGLDITVSNSDIVKLSPF